MTTTETDVSVASLPTVAALTAIAYHAIVRANGNGFHIDENEFKTKEELMNHVAMRVAARLGGGVK